MLGFILGSMFGGTIGVFTMCLCRTASDSDDSIGRDSPDQKNIYTNIK